MDHKKVKRLRQRADTFNGFGRHVRAESEDIYKLRESSILTKMNHPKICSPTKTLPPVTPTQTCIKTIQNSSNDSSSDSLLRIVQNLSSVSDPVNADVKWNKLFDNLQCECGLLSGQCTADDVDILI